MENNRDTNTMIDKTLDMSLLKEGEVFVPLESNVNPGGICCAESELQADAIKGVDRRFSIDLLHDPVWCDCLVWGGLVHARFTIPDCGLFGRDWGM